MVKEVWGLDDDQTLEAVTVNGADLNFMDLARAALQSLRQVDDETAALMVEYVDFDGPGTVTVDGAGAFRAFIDHILTEGGEG